MSVPCKYTNVSPFEPLGSWNWSQAWLKSGKRYTVSMQFLWISIWSFELGDITIYSGKCSKQENMITEILISIDT